MPKFRTTDWSKIANSLYMRWFYALIVGNFVSTI